MAFCELPAEACGAFGDATSAGLTTRNIAASQLKTKALYRPWYFVFWCWSMMRTTAKKKKTKKTTHGCVFSSIEAVSKLIRSAVLNHSSPHFKMFRSASSYRFEISGRFAWSCAPVAWSSDEAIVHLGRTGTCEVTDLSVELTWFRLQLFPSVRVRMCFLSSS